jgi:exopolysaccharide biosynthesis polyprenyl glycosylphosphotransferase
MMMNRSSGIRSLSLCLQVGLVVCSFWTWWLIWESPWLWDGGVIKRYLLYCEFLLVGILFGLGGKRGSGGASSEFVEAVRLSGRQGVLGLFSVFAVVFALRDTAVSRSFFFSFIPLLLLTLLFSNYLVPTWLSRWAFSGKRVERVVLAGTTEQAHQLKPWLERKSLLGFRTVGMLAPEAPERNGSPANGTNGHGAPFPVLGNLQQMGQVLKDQSVTQLILLDLSLGPDRLCELAQECEGAAVRVLALHDVNGYFRHSTTTFEDDGMRFIGLREEPLESPFNRFVKRAMDVAIALPVVTLLLPPVAALVMLIHRVQSPGPLFFRQKRVGMMGRPFKMFKFRTMHCSHGTEERQAVRQDPRVFPAGRWLRKMSIDELPQFLNVLRGDMSVVGPRPHMEEHEESWTRVLRRYIIRRFIRPGVTGWAQVNGFRGEVRSEADIQKRVEADIYYLEQWSIGLDVAVILKTAKQALFPPDSAY